MLGLVYGLMVLWPNDRRLPFRTPEPVAGARRSVAYDFLQHAGEARLSSGDFEAARARLSADPWVNARVAANKSDRVVQVSLGHPPQCFVRRRALYAPLASSYEFEVYVPTTAVLTFHYGTSSDEPVPVSARFTVEAVTSEGNSEKLFSQEIFSHEPFQTPRWRKLLPPSPALSQREAESHWAEAEVDLKKVAGRTVRLRFRAERTGSGAAKEDKPAHAFWAEPLLWISRPPKTPPRDSVVLVVMNSLRPDELEVHGAPRHSMASLDSLARQGIDYQRFYTNASSSRLAMTSLLSSRRIKQMGEAARLFHPEAAQRDRFYGNSPGSLVSALKDAGYRTVAMGPLAFLTDHPGPGVDWGFDELHAFAPSGYDTAQTFQAAETWLSQHEGEEPFLLILYLGAASSRSAPPLRHWGRGFDGLPRSWVDVDMWRHRAQLSYIDEYLGRFLQFLVDFGLEERCLISALSTRGAAFSPRPMLTPKGRAVWRSLPVSGIHLTEEEVHATWVLKHRRIAPGGIFQKPTQLLDVAPTVLTLLGLPSPGTFQGSTFPLALKPTDQVQPLPILIYAEGAKALLTEGHFKYIRRDWSAEAEGRGFFGKKTFRMPDDREELYDIWADPNEMRNLVQRERNLLSLARRVMDEVDPDPIETRVVFWGLQGQPVRGTVRLPGGQFRSFTGDGSPAQTGAYEYSFSIQSSSAEVRFETWPPALSYVLQFRVNEKPFSDDKMYFSHHGLPFLERRGVEWFDYNNFPWMEGAASPVPGEAGPAVYIGRRPSSASSTEWEGPAAAADRSLWADPLLKTTEAGQLRREREKFDEP